MTRRRDPANRRIQHVELTEAGETAFHRMRTAAMAFDQRLRTGLSSNDAATFTHLLELLHSNVIQ